MAMELRKRSAPKEDPSQIETEVMPVMKRMKVGETRCWPLSKATTVRSTASQMGCIYEVQFQCLSDRAESVMYVTRVK